MAAGCGALGAFADAATVDDARLRAAERDAANWITQRYVPRSEQRFSPLAQVDAKTVSRLGLAWSRPLDYERGVGGVPRWWSTSVMYL